MAGGGNDIGLGHRGAHRVGARHDGRLAHRRVLDQHALQLEGADAVVGGLEDIVGPAHVGDVALLIDAGHVAGAVVAPLHGRRRALRVVGIAHHQAGRARLAQGQGHLPLACRLVLGVEHHHPVAGQGAPHGARLERLARGVADLGGGLGLAEAVPDGEAPGPAHLLDHLGVEGLAGGHRLAQGDPMGGEVLLDQQPPHRGRRAEGGDRVVRQHLQQGGGVEARIVVEEDAGAGVPGGEEAAPGVLGPARRTDIEVAIPLLQADPVEGGEVAHRVGLMGMGDQLGLGSGARGEVEQHGVVGGGRPVRGEGVAFVAGVGEVVPSLGGTAHGDARQAVLAAGKLLQVLVADHQVPDLAAADAVLEVLRRQQGGGGNDHRAQLDGGQHHLPQRHLVAQHQQHPVAPGHAQGAQPVGDLVGAPRHLGEAELRLPAILLHDPQRRGVVVPGHDVEVVQGPVELGEGGPAEVPVGGVVVLAVGLQEVPGGEEALQCGRARRCRHVPSLSCC